MYYTELKTCRKIEKDLIKFLEPTYNFKYKKKEKNEKKVTT